MSRRSREMDEISKMIGFIASVCEEYGGKERYNDDTVGHRTFVLNDLKVTIEIEEPEDDRG